MKSKKNLIWLVLLLAGTIWILVKRNEGTYQQINGIIFGTIYNITYQSDKDLKPEIEAELKRFDSSLSPFHKTSIITLVNNNEDVLTDTLFQNCFNKAKEISILTDGAFDITVAPLVNAWGFGFKNGEFPDSLVIDSLRNLTGYDRIALIDGKIEKEDERLMLNCSAIAKGYAVDVIAQLLNRNGIRNYLVDIGGEIVAKGRNSRDGLWRIGVNKPVEDSLSVNQEIQQILQLTDRGMATSGNYRNFYYRDGKKYAHTIDPRTGYPVEHNLLSATVIAEDCMTADALATAFMVMGLEETKAYIKKHPEVDVYLIYSDDDGNYQMFYSDGMWNYIR